ncbi:MAG: SpoIIE family protein phosphatase [Rhodospirillaceae bacterium]|nr:SpoIIE family protein phosphatase [Rhodospirillaceae bacterium]
MTLSRRLIITVAASVGVAIVSVALAMGFLARDALIQQAEDQALLVAGLIASEANRAEHTADEIDRMIVRQMEAQALAIARYLDSHEHEEEDDDVLGAYFAKLTADSAVDDIWLLDRAGRPLVRAIGGLSESGAPDLASAGIDPRVVEALVSGRRFSVSFQSVPPMGWEKPVRYVGVRARTHETVLVGTLAAEAGGPGDIIGIGAALDSLASREAIRSIWVVNDLLHLIGMATFGGKDSPEADAALSADDADLATRVLGVDGAESYLGENALHVAAPILDRGGVATGAAVIHMQRDHLDRLFEDHIKFGLIVAAATFAIGSIIAAVSARRIVQPVTALTTAAAEVDTDTLSFAPETLDPVAVRRDELGTLVRVFQNMVRQVQAREEYLESMVRARTRELEASNAQLEKAKERMESELKIAHALQGAILPKTLPENPTYSGHAVMTPAREMGGDFYDFFTLDDGRLSLVMADVSGKGVPAAFFMAIARTVMRAAAARYPSPGPCLQEVNDAICEQNPQDLFVTLFYGILDPKTGEFVYANAGHNPPFVVKHPSEVLPLPMTGGMAVGVMPGMPYDEDAVTLAPGDTMFLYTDGITEAMNVEQEEFTEARLEAVLAEARDLPVDSVLENVTSAVVKFVGEAEQSDDITCIVLRYDGATDDRASG